MAQNTSRAALPGRPSDPVRNLDFLRAVAVLSVTASHYFGSGLRLFDRGYYFLHVMGGFGVMIFFVHTSLVLMMSLERAATHSLRGFVDFYVRRMFRIYPLSVATVLVMFLLRVPPDVFAPFVNLSARELISNLALTQNLTGAPLVLGTLWSLPWEVQMYVCLPFLFLLARRGMARIFGLLAGTVILVNTSGILSGHSAVRILDYFPCFFSGIAAFMALRRSDARRRLFPWQAWPAVVFVLLGAYIAAGGSSAPVFYAQWLMCASLGAMIPRFLDMPAGPLARSAHWIAQYSYGIYLFHVPALWLAFNVWGGLGWVGSTVVFILVTTVLSVGGYHLLESPLIEVGRRITSRGVPVSRQAAVSASARG